MKLHEVNITELRNLKGQWPCTLDDLKKFYKKLKRPPANSVKINGKVYVAFSTLPELHIYISEKCTKDSLGFIEELKFIEADKLKKGFFSFILWEFIQGDNFLKKSFRFLQTTFPLLVLNLIIMTAATKDNVANTFSILISAISVFVAIFSLFTVSHEYMQRKKLLIFETGKLSYYFSVDTNITKIGILALILSIYASLIVPRGNEMFSSVTPVYLMIIVLSVLNITFLFTYLILRSIVEFYIIRPGQFILGDMKKQSLENFEEEKN